MNEKSSKEQIIELIGYQKSLFKKSQDELNSLIKKSWCIGYVLAFIIAYINEKRINVNNEFYMDIFSVLICKDVKLPEDELVVVNLDNKPTRQIIEFHQGIEAGKIDADAYFKGKKIPTSLYRYLQKKSKKKWLFF